MPLADSLCQAPSHSSTHAEQKPTTALAPSHASPLLCPLAHLVARARSVVAAAASTLTSYRTPRQLAALPCRPSPETRVPASVTTPVAAEQCRLPAAGPSPLIPLSKLHYPLLPLAVLTRCTC